MSAAPGLPLSDDAVWLSLDAIRPKLIRIAASRAPAVSMAEDLVQEAIIRTAGQPGVRLEGLEAYATQVVRRLCVDARREVERDRRIALRMGAWAEQAIAEDDDICDRALGGFLAQHLGRLSERDQQILLLAGEGLTPKQISDELGVNYKTTHKALNRARTVMKAVISGLGIAVGWIRRNIKAKAHLSLAAVLAAVVAVVVLAPYMRSVLAPRTGNRGVSRFVSSYRGEAKSSDPLGVRPGASPAAAQTSRVSSVAQAPRVVIATRPIVVKKGVLEVGRGSVTDNVPHQTLMQSIRWCLTHGFPLGPGYLICNPN